MSVPRACGDEPGKQSARTTGCVPRACMNRPLPLQASVATVFPAPAGMNRFLPRCLVNTIGVPRACGDEPSPRFPRPTQDLVFPAPAGMNRSCLFRVRNRVPRACGDEPPFDVYPTGQAALDCVPRAGGDEPAPKVVPMLTPFGSVFPAPAGMNRRGQLGKKPSATSVFPAPAGMNRDIRAMPTAIRGKVFPAPAGMNRYTALS